jgi:cyclase
MRRVRVIPSLLLRGAGLVKSKRFKDHVYVGDPINAVRIFNQKEVDELAVIDIDATREGRGPDMGRIEEIVSEAFIPIAYGGGISTVEQVKEILFRGVEKVIINKAAVADPGLITKAAGQFGSQSIVVSIDVKKTVFRGKRVFTDNGKSNTGLDPVEFARSMEAAGAGELLLNSIDRDGTYEGYDLELVEAVSRAVSIPVIAAGGASSLGDFRSAAEKGASALAAGSMFVFQRPHNAVLISYPSQKDLMAEVYSRLNQNGK